MASTEEMRANQFIIDIDKAMRSERDADRCEAIIQCSRIFDEFPFSSVVNATFLRLGDAFRSGTNIMRVYIVKEVRQNRQHLSKLTNVSEFLRPILAVMHSNDYIARALTLYLLASISATVKDKHEVHHFIREALLSQHDIELTAAVGAAAKFTDHSAHFAENICEDLIALLGPVSSETANHSNYDYNIGSENSRRRLPESTKCNAVDIFPAMYRYQCKPHQVYEALKHMYEQPPYSASAELRRKILVNMTQLAINTLLLVPDHISFLLARLLNASPTQSNSNDLAIFRSQNNSIEDQLQQICSACGHSLTAEQVVQIEKYLQDRLVLTSTVPVDDACCSINTYKSLCRRGLLPTANSAVPDMFMANFAELPPDLVTLSVADCQCNLLENESLSLSIRSAISASVLHIIERVILTDRLQFVQCKLLRACSLAIMYCTPDRKKLFLTEILSSLRRFLVNNTTENSAFSIDRIRFILHLSLFDKTKLFFYAVECSTAGTAVTSGSLLPYELLLVHIARCYLQKTQANFDVFVTMSALLFNVFQGHSDFADNYIALLKLHQQPKIISSTHLIQISQLATTFGCFTVSHRILAGLNGMHEDQDESTFLQIITAVSEAETLVQLSVEQLAKFYLLDEGKADEFMQTDDGWQCTTLSVQQALTRALDYYMNGVEFYLNTLKAHDLLAFRSLYVRARIATLHAMRFAVQAVTGPLRMNGGRIFNRMFFIECAKHMREAELLYKELSEEGFDTEASLLHLIDTTRRSLFELAKSYDYMVEKDFSVPESAAPSSARNSPASPASSDSSSSLLPMQKITQYGAQCTAHAELMRILQKIRMPSALSVDEKTVTRILLEAVVEEKRFGLYRAVCRFLSIPHVLPACFYRRRQLTTVRFNVHPPADRPSVAVSESYLTLKVEGIVEVAALPPVMPFDLLDLPDPDEDDELVSTRCATFAEYKPENSDLNTKCKPLRTVESVLLRVESRLVREHNQHAPKSIREQLSYPKAGVHAVNNMHQVLEKQMPVKVGGFFSHDFLINVKATGDHAITVSVKLRDTGTKSEAPALWHVSKEATVMVKSVAS